MSDLACRLAALIRPSDPRSDEPRHTSAEHARAALFDGRPLECRGYPCGGGSRRTAGARVSEVSCADSSFGPRDRYRRDVQARGAHAPRCSTTDRPLECGCDPIHSVAATARKDGERWDGAACRGSSWRRCRGVSRGRTLNITP